MEEVYIRNDKIPTNCYFCEYQGMACNVDCSECWSRCEYDCGIKRPPYCPLRSLEQHDEELSKQILDEVSKRYGDAYLVELYKKYKVGVGE